MKTFKLFELLNKSLPIIMVILFSNFWSIQSYSQSNLKISVMDLDRKDSISYLYVAIHNTTNQKAVFNLEATVSDLHGKKYKMEPYGSPNIFTGEYDENDTHLILFPPRAGLTLTSKTVACKLTSKDTTIIPMIIKFVFKVPKQFNPNKFVLFTGGPSSIINISNLPLLSNLKITINKQPSDFIVTINKSFRSYEGFNENTPFLGLIKLLRKIGGISDTTNISITNKSTDDFYYSSDDIWIATSFSFKNTTQTTIELPINKLVIVPKITNEPGQIIKPIGKLLKNECSVSDSFDEIISIPTGSSFNTILIYKAKMWMNDFTFELK